MLSVLQLPLDTLVIYFLDYINNPSDLKSVTIVPISGSTIDLFLLPVFFLILLLVALGNFE